MYLSEIKLWNFRKYGIKNGEAFDKAAPSLDVHFHNGVNVLIGENDSGKTTIIDAIRYVLHTKSGEPIYIASNPQPIGFSGILLAKRQNSFYCTYFLHNRNVADTKSPYPSNLNSVNSDCCFQ